MKGLRNNSQQGRKMSDFESEEVDYDEILNLLKWLLVIAMFIFIYINCRNIELKERGLYNRPENAEPENATRVENARPRNPEPRNNVQLRMVPQGARICLSLHSPEQMQTILKDRKAELKKHFKKKWIAESIQFWPFLKLDWIKGEEFTFPQTWHGQIRTISEFLILNFAALFNVFVSWELVCFV